MPAANGPPIIWLTGGRGFIGRHLTELLRSKGVKAVPVTVDPEAAQVADGRHFLDLSDSGAIRHLIEEMGTPKAFVHLGWGGMTTPDAEIHLTRNLVEGKSLIDRVYAIGVPRFVLIGSIDEYGDNEGALFEAMEGNGRLTRYAQAKRDLCTFGLAEAERLGRSFLHVRLSNTYGPGQRPGALLNKLFQLHATSERVDLGPCDNFRDYIYVGEAAEGIARITSLEGQTVINLGGGQSIQLREFVLAFWQRLGANPARLNFGAISRRPDEPRQPRAWLNLSRLKAQTGWSPTLSIQEGLDKTIASLESGAKG